MPLDPPAEPTEPAARAAVRQLFLTPDEELQRRAAVHKPSFAKVWMSGTHTAAEFFAEAGTQGVLFMTVAGLNIQQMAEAAALIGKTLHDYLQPEDYVPPLAYTAHADGTITINS